MNDKICLILFSSLVILCDAIIVHDDHYGKNRTNVVLVRVLVRLIISLQFLLQVITTTPVNGNRTNLVQPREELLLAVRRKGRIFAALTVG